MILAHGRISQESGVCDVNRLRHEPRAEDSDYDEHDDQPQSFHDNPPFKKSSVARRLDRFTASIVLDSDIKRLHRVGVLRR